MIQSWRSLRGLFDGRCPTLALVVLASLGSACAPAEATTPQHAVMQLYAMLDALGVHSVPDAPALRALRPFLGDSLAEALGRADAARTQAAQQEPDEKPPFADGDPFSSLFEGRTDARPDTVLVQGDTAFVVMAFANATQKPAVNWRDTVVVTRVDGRYVVADIRYGTDWEFGFTGRLLDLLQHP